MTKRRPKVSKAIPEFSSEDEERRFLGQADTPEKFYWGPAAGPALPQPKPSTESISLRLPVSMLEEIKALANKRDVPYQSLMKIFLAERIQRERGRKAS